jgi:hypothetical protein
MTLSTPTSYQAILNYKSHIVTTLDLVSHSHYRWPNAETVASFPARFENSGSSSSQGVTVQAGPTEG